MSVQRPCLPLGVWLWEREALLDSYYMYRPSPVCTGGALRMGLGEGVPMTGVQSFQEPGLRDRNPSFLSLLPPWVNQTPSRPESVRNWSHIPGHLPHLWISQLGFRPGDTIRPRVQGKEGGWVGGFCL